MQDYIYSSIAFVAMAIHLTINSSHLPGRMVVSTRGAREYHWFLKSVFAYYIVDAGWGVFAGLGWTKVLYVDVFSALTSRVRMPQDSYAVSYSIRWRY